jgi:hypothetical protein
MGIYFPDLADLNEYVRAIIFMAAAAASFPL